MGEDRGKDNFSALRKIVEGLGYECVGITLGNEEKRAILRVYIDSLGGILVKDCETVSRSLNRFLDENGEYIRGQFYLEVSSPGSSGLFFRRRITGSSGGRRSSSRPGRK
jgi:Uncharacterized protein conserved in bacteria